MPVEFSDPALIPRDQDLIFRSVADGPPSNPVLAVEATGDIEFTSNVTSLIMTVGGEGVSLPTMGSPGLTPSQAAAWVVANWQPSYLTTANASGAKVTFAAKQAGVSGNSYAINVPVGAGVIKSGNTLAGGADAAPAIPLPSRPAQKLFYGDASPYQMYYTDGVMWFPMDAGGGGGGGPSDGYGEAPNEDGGKDLILWNQTREVYVRVRAIGTGENQQIAFFDV